MAAIDFPSAPILNQVFAANNGVSYIWNGAIWITVSSGAAQASDTPPSNPVVNQLWFNSALGQLFIYYNDGSSSQWVPANPSAGAVVPAGALYLYNENVLTAVGTQIVVTIPPTPKLVQLEFGLQSTGGVNDNYYLQMMQSGVPLTSAVYDTQYMVSQAGAVSAAAVNNGTGWTAASGVTASGTIKFSWFASTLQTIPLGTSDTHEVATGGLRNKRNHGLYCNSFIPGGLASVTGFRMTATNNLVVGSYMRCFVVT